MFDSHQHKHPSDGPGWSKSCHRVRDKAAQPAGRAATAQAENEPKLTAEWILLENVLICGYISVVDAEMHFDFVAIGDKELFFCYF